MCKHEIVHFNACIFYFSSTSARSKENDTTKPLDILRCTGISEHADYLFMFVVAYKYSTEDKKICIIEANKMHYFATLFLISSSTCFGQTFFPSSGVLILYLLQSVFDNITTMTSTSRCENSIKTPDDGQ
jgi:hypothetical protein